MVLEPPGGPPGGEVPQSEGLVPRPGEGEVAVGGEDDVGDEVPVAVEALLRDAVVGVVAGQLPHDQGLVAGGGQDHVRVLRVGRDLKKRQWRGKWSHCISDSRTRLLS